MSVFSAQNIADSLLAITAVDEMAQYPGGMPAFVKFISNNYRLTGNSVNNHMGCCLIHFKFKISKNGKASDAKLLKNACEISDAEEQIKLAVNAMPLWKPAKSKGVPVNSYISMPFRIRIR